eukprot:Pgem_evm1s16350
METPEKAKLNWTFIMIFENSKDNVLFTLPDETDVEITLSDTDLLQKLQAEITDNMPSREMLVN